MNKTQLTEALASKTNMKKKDAEVAVNCVFAAMTEALVKGEKVQISGFGSFETKARAARIGRNPHTHEKMEIPAKFDFIKEEDIPLIAQRALKEGNPLYPVPKIMDQADCEKLIKQLMA